MNVKRILCAILALLMLALSFASVYADGDHENDEAHDRVFPYSSGTYDGYAYTFDAREGTGAKVKSKCTYGASSLLTLKFHTIITYTTVGGGSFDYSDNSNALDYSYYGLSALKSYTVVQAASHFPITINGVQTTLDTILGSDAHFRKCVYILSIGGNQVKSFTCFYGA